MLPGTILTATEYLKTIMLFRKSLGEELLKDKGGLTQAGPTFNTTLSLMLQMSDQPYLMDLFKAMFVERTRTLRRSEKRDPAVMARQLESTLKDVIWPVSRTFSYY